MGIFQKVSTAYYAFQIARYGGLLVVSILLAWIFPNHPLIGIYEQFLLLGSAVTFFWVSALFDSYLTLLRNGENGGGWVRTALHSGLLFAILSGLAIAIIGSVTLDETYGFGLWGYAVFMVGESLSLLLVHFLYHNQKTLKLWLYSAFSPIAYGLALILPLISDPTFAASGMCLAGLGMLKVVWLVWEFWPHYSSEVKGKFPLRTLLQVALPISFAFLLSRSSEFVDGYLVLNFAPEQFALFRYGAKELPIVLMLANAFSTLSAAQYANAKPDQRKEILNKIRNRSGKMILGFTLLTALLLVLSKPLFVAVFGNSFAGAHTVFDVYLLLLMPRLLFPQSILRGLLKTRALTLSAGIELVLNIALSLAFLPVWGLPGIAMATVLAFACEKLFLMGVLWKQYGVSPALYTPIVIWLLSGLVLSGLYIGVTLFPPF